MFTIADKPENKEKKKKKEEPSSLFQRQRVDMLLAELGKKYPPQFIAPSQPEHKGSFIIVRHCHFVSF